MNTQTSRRQFLRRTSLALGAAVVAPTIIPASALGRDGAVAPSERINMGFIGLGGQGSGHLLGGAWTYVPGGYSARKDVQVRAICDVRKGRRDNAMSRLKSNGLNDVQGYTDFRELFARPDIDAVLIAVPYHWAAMMAIMAMKAGKDVYCEKPISVTIREGQEIIKTAKRYNRVYQSGMQQRSEYAGRFRTTCDYVRNGRIGQLKEVYTYREPGCFYLQNWTSDGGHALDPNFDWDLWLGPLPKRPFPGDAGHTLDGFFIGDVNWSPHHYDIVQWTINPDVTAPIEIICEPHSSRNPNQAKIHYKYSNGVIAHAARYPNEPIGDDGGAVFVGTEGRIAVDRGHLVSYPGTVLNEPLRPGDSRVERNSGHSDNFLECVKTRRQTICHPETCVYTMNAILTGGIAMALQRSLTWDPVKVEFVGAGSQDANRLLSYTPRAPWHL